VFAYWILFLVKLKVYVVVHIVSSYSSLIVFTSWFYFGLLNNFRFGRSSSTSEICPHHLRLNVTFLDYSLLLFVAIRSSLPSSYCHLFTSSPFAHRHSATAEFHFYHLPLYRIYSSPCLPSASLFIYLLEPLQPHRLRACRLTCCCSINIAVASHSPALLFSPSTSFARLSYFSLLLLSAAGSALPQLAVAQFKSSRQPL
jgi:hypothetical protein